jgi:uncharacterized protein YprB with RNaseH-like and TPR domain
MSSLLRKLRREIAPSAASSGRIPPPRAAGEQAQVAERQKGTPDIVARMRREISRIDDRYRTQIERSTRAEESQPSIREPRHVYRLESLVPQRSSRELAVRHLARDAERTIDRLVNPLPVSKAPILRTTPLPADRDAERAHTAWEAPSSALPWSPQLARMQDSEFCKPVDANGLLYHQALELPVRFGSSYIEPPTPKDARRMLEAQRVLGTCPVEGPCEGIRPEEILFVDTETTGLSRAAGTLAFLIGVARFRNGKLDLDQILIADPAREAEALALFADYLCQSKLIVSFNGASFDLPILRSRAMVNRVDIDLDTPHLDLLFATRRLFKTRLSNCRLSTVERELYRFVRSDDIAGHLIPMAYRRFIFEGVFDEIARVLDHNKLDLLTMPLLARDIASRIAAPLQHAEDADELSAIGALLQANAAPRKAAACHERSLQLGGCSRSRQLSLRHLARDARRDGNAERALSLWQQFAREFPQRDSGYIEQAKIHEHMTKKLDKALALTERAPHNWLPSMQKRLERLRRRLTSA